jgi:hypothetical protein
VYEQKYYLAKISSYALITNILLDRLTLNDKGEHETGKINISVTTLLLRLLTASFREINFSFEGNAD